MTTEQGSHREQGIGAPSTTQSADLGGTGVASAAGGTATDSGDRLQQAAGSVVERVADTTQQKVGSQVDSQLGRAATTLEQLASAVRQTGEQLRTDQPQMAGFADTAAMQVDRAARYLQQTDMQGLLRGAEDVARRQPALFLGGAVALGLVAARFLKASPRDVGRSGYPRYRNSYAGQRAYGGGNGHSGTYARSTYGRPAYSPMDTGGYGTASAYDSGTTDPRPVDGGF